MSWNSYARTSETPCTPILANSPEPFLVERDGPSSLDITSAPGYVWLMCPIGLCKKLILSFENGKPESPILLAAFNRQLVATFRLHGQCSRELYMEQPSLWLSIISNKEYSFSRMSYFRINYFPLMYVVLNKKQEISYPSNLCVAWLSWQTFLWLWWRIKQLVAAGFVFKKRQ